MTTVEPYRKVLLVLVRHAPDSQVFDSVKSLCERMQAGLEIVCLGTEVHDADAQAMAAKLTNAGLFCRVDQRPDWGLDDVVTVANDRPCVAALVVAAADLPENDRDASEAPWNRLGCPLVVSGREQH